MSESKKQFMEMRESDQNEEYTTGTRLTINPTSFISLDKERLTALAMETVDKYGDGFKSPVEGLILAKKLIDYGELLKTNLADSAANELKLSKDDKRVVHGNSITEQMVGVKYDYGSTGDKTWLKLNEQIKEREAFLKTVTKPQITGDPDTGEAWEVKPPVKSGKLALIIKY